MGTAASNHNVKNRHQIMADALSETYELDAIIKAANDKHIKPVRAAKGDIKKRLNMDLNITAAVFQAAYAAYKVEAKAIEDEDDATLENLREYFKACPVGTQVDFIDAAEARS